MGFPIAAWMAEGSTTSIVIRRTRHLYPDPWIHSGRPTLWGNKDLVRSWTLVRYDRGRAYPRPAEMGGETFPPLTDAKALHFAERQRLPLLIGHFAGVAGVFLAVAALLLGTLIASP